MAISTISTSEYPPALFTNGIKFRKYRHIVMELMYNAETVIRKVIHGMTVTKCAVIESFHDDRPEELLRSCPSKTLKGTTRSQVPLVHN